MKHADIRGEDAVPVNQMHPTFHMYWVAMLTTLWITEQFEVVTYNKYRLQLFFSVEFILLFFKNTHQILFTKLILNIGFNFFSPVNRQQLLNFTQPL